MRQACTTRPRMATRYDVVVELVRAGADMKLLDHGERTPLDCCTKGQKRDWEKVAKFLKDPQFRHDELQRLAIDGVDDATDDLRGSGLVWIDALCINQTDIDERSAQVRLMPQIYSNASCVIVWLGHVRDLETQNWQEQANMKDIICSVNKMEKKLATLERQWLVSLR